MTSSKCIRVGSVIRYKPGSGIKITEVYEGIVVEKIGQEGYWNILCCWYHGPDIFMMHEERMIVVTS